MSEKISEQEVERLFTIYNRYKSTAVILSYIRHWGAGGVDEVTAESIQSLLNSYAAQKAEIARLREAMQVVLRYIDSHQAYDKDARGILLRALNEPTEEKE